MFQDSEQQESAHQLHTFSGCKICIQKISFMFSLKEISVTSLLVLDRKFLVAIKPQAYKQFAKTAGHVCTYLMNVHVINNILKVPSHTLVK